ncbi:MAG TPA: polyprenyl diphosphate synthase [Pseudonocardiaceae bacterium]|nr:polyprenyl diphosphate synthase [Pseudonocardiaceae bacterium]
MQLTAGWSTRGAGGAGAGLCVLASGRSTRLVVLSAFVVDILVPLRRLYALRLRRRLSSVALPEHVALIMDGNRRWATKMGMANPSSGHQHGAAHALRVLSWCEQLGIRHVTVFVCSTENLIRRDQAEVAFLTQVIEQTVTEELAKPGGRWRVHVAGSLDLLPDGTAATLKHAVEITRDRDVVGEVTLAVGYGGRQELVDAVRELLYEAAAADVSLAYLATRLTTDDIGRHLDTTGQPDPDLVIRTSGEQRLSNFLLWQGVRSELYFCDAYWPAFREIDFLRALRTFAERNRRHNS